MRKLFFLLLVLCSVSANAQKLFSKEWKLKQLGKDSASIAAREREEFMKTQKIEKPIAYYYNFDTPQDGLKMSGKLLKKSACYQYSAIGFGLVGTGLACAAPYQDEVSKRNAFLFSGGGMVLVGLIFQIKSIDYKFKSGKVLEMSAGKMAFRF